MKKILYIIAAATLSLTACQKELSEVQPVNPVNKEVATVTVPFTVTIPGSQDAPTRGDHDIANAPVLKNLYIAIFGENGGILQQFVPAKKGDNNSAIGYANRSLYTAELPLYDDECHLHFIGNYEGDIAELNFDREQAFIESLTTAITLQEHGDYKEITDAPSVFWQKVILADGIKSQPGPDGTIEIADATKQQLQKIALVRNFAKITVTASSTAKFDVVSYALINVPYQGTLAPVHPTTGYNNHYMNIGKYCDGTYDVTNTSATNYHNFVTDLMASNYIGYMGTNDLIFTGNPGTYGIVNIDDTDNGMYMYERTVPTRSGEQTGVIVKLHWHDLETTDPDYFPELATNKDYWYKIEVLDKDGEYMPICRNVHYNIVLSKLTGEGSVDFDGAFNGPFFGNVSSSIETATLTTINDNIHQISVNRMDYFSVQGEDEVDLYFQFWLDKEGDPLTNPANYYVAPMTVSGYDQAIASVSTIELVTDENDPEVGKMHVKVTLKAKDSDGNTLRGKVRIQGLNNSGIGSLYRDVVFTVMEIQDFTTETTITTSVADEDEVIVNIGIPRDLPYTMFPLQVKIESLNNNLTTNSADLPVGYGASAFSGKPNTFYFIKTIQYKDYVNTSTGVYQYTTKFPCTFQRLDDKAVSVKLNEINGFFHEVTKTL